MYIFGYFFQKGHFKGSSEKRAHQQKTFGGGGLTTPLLPPAPEGLKSQSLFFNKVAGLRPVSSYK